MEYYHTQENRNEKITGPIMCTKDNAWLGNAYYFWEDKSDAIYWGSSSKRKTGKYEIYKAQFAELNVLDTVFNRLEYEFFVKQIEKISIKFIKTTGFKPTLKEINDYLMENNVLSEVDGILFQDISSNPHHYLVRGMQYKKRIQLALYNRNKISTFVSHYEGVCN